MAKLQILNRHLTDLERRALRTHALARSLPPANHIPSSLGPRWIHIVDWIETFGEWLWSGIAYCFEVIDEVLEIGPGAVFVEFDFNREVRISGNVIIELFKKFVTVGDVVHEFPQPSADPTIGFKAKLRTFDLDKGGLQHQHQLVFFGVRHAIIF
jgi:hypothetical protein